MMLNITLMCTARSIVSRLLTYLFGVVNTSSVMVDPSCIACTGTILIIRLICVIIVGGRVRISKQL